MILELHLWRQRDWSFKTFGRPHDSDTVEQMRFPALSIAGVLDHIEKEIAEAKDATTRHDAGAELIDVVILALDGIMRLGFSPEEAVAMLDQKQTKNEGRRWPDWRTATPGKAIEHIRDEEDGA